MEDLDEPRVDALLTTIDQVVNSNTLLLKARADVCVGSSNHLEVAERFLRNRLFVHLMRQADRSRKWDNLRHDPLSPTPSPSTCMIFTSTTSYAPWSFHDLRPTFLHHNGYYTNHEPTSAAAYFDGGSSDTATFMHRGDIILLLLTNGSP